MTDEKTVQEMHEVIQEPTEESMQAKIDKANAETEADLEELKGKFTVMEQTIKSFTNKYLSRDWPIRPNDKTLVDQFTADINRRLEVVGGVVK